MEKDCNFFTLLLYKLIHVMYVYLSVLCLVFTGKSNLRIKEYIVTQFGIIIGTSVSIDSIRINICLNPLKYMELGYQHNYNYTE